MTPMFEYDAATYGEHIAEVYDQWPRLPDDTEETVAFLVEQAVGGPTLELGIGTGRVALPLAVRGIAVQGIEASAAMLARLRAKPGGDAIPVHLGDFADVAVPGLFPLVYAVFSTFFALPSQQAQVRCFANVAAHLPPGGSFVIEAFVPDPSRFDRGQRTETLRIATKAVYLASSRHDPVEQRVWGQTILVEEAGIRLYPIQVRYAWPSELDLMARLAGLRLHERWGGWTGEPFTAVSRRHVSVYRADD